MDQMRLLRVDCDQEGRSSHTHPLPTYTVVVLEVELGTSQHRMH